MLAHATSVAENAEEAARDVIVDARSRRTWIGAAAFAGRLDRLPPRDAPRMRDERVSRMSDARPVRPLAIGEALGSARVTSIAIEGGEALVAVELASGDRVTFAISAAPRERGPFEACPFLTYRATPMPFASFREIGRALAERIGSDLSAVRAWVEHRPERDFRETIRALAGRPDASVRVRDLLPRELLDARACTLPWTHLELGQSSLYGPCCSDFQTSPARSDGGPLALWRSPAMRAFRRALASPDPSATCRTTCTRLAGRTDSLAELVVRGGAPRFVANQLDALDAILAGDDDPRSTPLELVFTSTTFCNYDCLMCRCGELGTLEDERPRAFYDALTPLLPGLGAITALGGEPLASPIFREVLASEWLADHPDVRVSLTTNGSYLTPGALARWRSARFGHVTVSLNAASEATYAKVNRGLPLARIRENLDALLDARRTRRSPRSIAYSMVILRSNVHEVRAFAELALRDDVGLRFMLPMHDRNGESILCDRAAMIEAERALSEVASELDRRGREGDARRARGEAEVLRTRIELGILRPLPDDLVALRAR